MNQVKRSYMQEVIVGLFMTTIFGVLIFFTVIISGVDLIRGHSRIRRVVQFDTVGSLHVQDNVIVRGMHVGSVESLKLRKDHIEATILIDGSVAIYPDYSIQIVSASVLGGNRLEITEGSKGEPLAADVKLYGETPFDLVSELSGLVAEFRGAVDMNDVSETLRNLRMTSSAFATITKRLERGEGTLGKLLSNDATLYNDLQASVQSLKHISGSLEQGKGTLGKLLTQDDVYDSLKDTLVTTRTIAKRLEEGRGTIGKLLSEDETLYADLAGSMKNIHTLTNKIAGGDSTLLVDLESSAASLKVILSRMEKGEGTLGHLMTDDTLAIEVEGAVKDVRQIIDNMRDTAPITSFTSIFFGGM